MKYKLLGPPGTGKTTRLLEYLERELEKGIPAERIAFLTFTRAARMEALHRANKTEKEFPFCKTIHSICYHQLGVGRDQVVRPENIRVFGKKIGIKLTGADLDPWIEEYERTLEAATRDDVLLQINHHGRHRKIMLKEALENASFDIDYKYAVWFTNAYRAWKTAEGILDYTDLLSRYVEYGKPLDIDVLFVDEAQDLSRLQWEVVNILGQKAGTWYVAGDDDQAIFNWAGADSSVFQDFRSDSVEVLNESHRLSRAVHGAARKITDRIKKRLPKEYQPRDSQGSVQNAGYITTTDLSEKTYLLFRNHFRGADLASILKRERIPYIGKGSPVNSKETRVALYAWYNLFKKKEETSERVKTLIRFMDEEYLNPMARNLVKQKPILGIDEVFISRPNYHNWYFTLKNLPGRDTLPDLIRHAGILRCALPKVELMSIHQSKGREAHTVIIDPDMSRSVFNNMIHNPDDEHRVWYVAVTRAKERVFLLLPNGAFSYRF